MFAARTLAGPTLPFTLLVTLALTGNALGEPEPDDADDDVEEVSSTPVLVGRAHDYTPALGLNWRGMRLELPLQLAGRLEGVSRYPVDRELTPLRLLNAGDIQVRVGLRFNSRRAILPLNVGVEYEHDVITGSIGEQPDLRGEGLPSSGDAQHQLRKAFGRVSLGYYLHLSGGFNVSHWGMGLIANDGAHGWAPGSARFADPRGGDRVLRLALATGPLGRHAFQAAAGFDWVQGDDAMLEGDTANQVFAAVTLGVDKPSAAGIYAVFRQQKDPGGDETSVGVIDFYTRHRWRLPRGLLLGVELEGVAILGTTQLAASTSFPEKKVRQLGVAARLGLDGRRAGGVLDLLYASGDADFDDDQQNAFRPDPNYDMGLLLYREVLAAQTGRSVHTASDLTLVGRAADDRERFATRGSAANTVALFPRAFWRPANGVELYGGPLFAFTASRYTDPRNTRLAGGAPRNPLDRTPGTYLGTELDLGLRYQALLAGTLLQAGFEVGVLFPGSALEGEDGAMTAVVGGRALLGYRF